MPFEILKRIFYVPDGLAWTDFIYLRTRNLAGSCECGNESSHFTHSWVFTI